MAAPRAERSEGLMAVEEVDGDRIVVVAGKIACRFVAIRGVWEVPPERMTWNADVSGLNKRVQRECEH